MNVIDDENVTEDYQCEKLFVLGKQDATVSLSISGKQIDILLDLGASVNTIVIPSNNP